MTRIKAKKDLFNGGRCFTKGKIYLVAKDVSSTAQLMDCKVINDQEEPHIIGNFWKDFKIVNSKIF